VSTKRRTLAWDVSFKGRSTRTKVDAAAKTDALYKEAARAYGLPDQQFDLVFKGKRLSRGVDLSDASLLPTSPKNTRGVLIVPELPKARWRFPFPFW